MRREFTNNHKSTDWFGQISSGWVRGFSKVSPQRKTEGAVLKMREARKFDKHFLSVGTVRLHFFPLYAVSTSLMSLSDGFCSP